MEALIGKAAAGELMPSTNTRNLPEKIASDCGLDDMDSVHIALARENEMDVLLSTDKDLYLYKKDCVSKYGIVVKNPVEYVGLSE